MTTVMRSLPKPRSDRGAARRTSGPSASARPAGSPGAGRPSAGPIAALSGSATLRLRLYIAGEGPNSRAALANLQALLRAHGPADCELEVVDCLREPIRALRDGVLVTPTLLRLSPLPSQTIVGTLSRTRSVLAALGLPAPQDRLDEASND